ncbi:SAP domain-containing ribonucleoprotein [Amia ocellicauda]|uniref:SAP domain-containing ribonucleoprotein n=1 Tax=Amia ocellicauda TaxID=2972642 RepID=UPI00346462D6
MQKQHRRNTVEINMDVLLSVENLDVESTYDDPENESLDESYMEEEIALDEDEAGFKGDVHSHMVSFKTFAAMPPQERMQKRMERFGEAVSEQAKKEARALRFGIPVYSGIEKQNLIHQEKLRKRKERFGVVMNTTSQLDNQVKKRMRAERFGIKCQQP